MHLPTIVIMTLATNVLIGFYLSVLYRRKPKDKCFKLWSLSCGSFVIGAALASSRSYNIPAFFTFFVADFLLILTPTLILLGLIQFSRFRYTKRKRKQYLGAFITVVILLLVTFQHPQLVSFIAALASASLFGLCAYLLHKSVINEPILTRTLKTIFIVHSVVMLIQAILIIIDWGTINQNGLPESSIYTLLSHILLTTLTALLLPWLCFLKLERKLTLKSQRDGLSKLANREYFFSQIARYWQEYPSLPTAVMMIDIDLFKNINDNFGHATGDRTIKLVAQVLSKQLRSNDIIGRVGGEEYAALLVDIDQHTAFKIAQRLCEQVAKQLRFIGKDEVEVTISIGMAQLKPANYSYEAALKAADVALYASKESGRNTVSIGKIKEN